MPRLGRLLAVAFLTIGLPALVLSQWRNVVLAHGFDATLITVGWEVIVAAGWVFSKIAAVPAMRRFEELGNALDRALGLRMSPYGRTYRRWVLDSRRFMESKGLATVGDFTPELDEVFVDVGLVPGVPHQIAPGILSDAPLKPADRQSIWEFLTTRGEPVVLAVIGAPGSGKTTLLSHTARYVARTPDQRRRRIPVLLQLRDHAAQVAADPGITLPQLLREVLPPLSVTEPPGWWDSRLNRGRCVVLLDGLDEVGSADERQKIGAWVNRQIAVYPNNDYVLTSRPHGYRSNVIESAKVLQVRPFTHEQVRQFLFGWYLAVERRATSSSTKEVEDVARDAATDLLDRLAATPALYDLTINPLLLAMIANVHRYRGSLPGSRADLYGEMCQVMLWRRQESKRLPLQLHGPSKERTLAGLAYLMMSSRVRDLRYADVLKALQPGLSRLSTDVTPKRFLADVVSNGLLVERERGLYAYAHLTFQEYLAAKHIKDHDLGQQLTETVEDGWWRETTLLYVAGGDGDAIVRACLSKGSPAALSLAFECLETGAELAPDLRVQLSRILTETFRAGADASSRQMAAGVLAARHLRQVVPVSGGGLICPRPIPTGLYWLFLQEAEVPSPEAPCPPDLSGRHPVTGVWRSDATSFVAWLNRARAGSGGPSHRLPTRGEILGLFTSPAAAAQLASSVTSSWTQEHDATVPQLWTAGGRPSPRTLTVEQLIAATAEDVRRFDLLRRLQGPAVVHLVRALTARSSPLLYAEQVAHLFVAARSKLTDPEMFGPVRGLIGELNRSLKRDTAIAEQIYRALLLSDQPAIDRKLAAELTDALARYGAAAMEASLSRASALDRELTIASQASHDFGLGHANVYARSINSVLTRAAARLSALARAEPSPGLTRSAIVPALGLDTAAVSQPRGDVTSILAAVMGGAITRAFLAGSRQNDKVGRVHAFASALVIATEMAGNERLAISLEQAAESLRRGCQFFYVGGQSLGRAATIAARLLRHAEPFLTRRSPLDSKNVGLIRLPALTLATEAARGAPEEVRDHCQAVAAAATLLVIRAKQPAALEGLILAQA